MKQSFNICVLVQMSETLEAKVEAHMQESVQAAQAAADAESRAASMHDAMMRALRDQQGAEARATQLESKIREEVNVRLRVIGADRSLWPQVSLQSSSFRIPILNRSCA